MGKLLSIDPGNTVSAWMLYDSDESRPVKFGIEDNGKVLDLIYQSANWGDDQPGDLAVEMIASYGMAVGREVFETCVFIGRLIEAWSVSAGGCNPPARLVYRQAVKLKLCHSVRAKDANVRQALMDRFGSTREKAIGTKKNPGPLYGVSKHVWSALAVAVADGEGEAGK